MDLEETRKIVTYIAFTCVLTLAIVYFINADHMTADQRAGEIMDKASPILASPNTLNYDKFKRLVPDSDPVEYSATRKLLNNGKLNKTTLANELR